jgi:hypothetical protein
MAEMGNPWWLMAIAPMRRVELPTTGAVSANGSRAADLDNRPEHVVRLTRTLASNGAHQAI